MPMTVQNIESELSYAYIHAIAGKAGMSCKPGDRHDDGEGVDAEVNYRGPLDHPYLTQIQLNIQLKSTIKSPGGNPDYNTYFLQGTNRYDKLRTNDSNNYKFLVVLFLPEDPEKWLQCSADELILKNAAYWVNLYGAPESKNGSGETIYLPKSNLLTPMELLRIVDMAAKKTIPSYSNF